MKNLCLIIALALLSSCHQKVNETAKEQKGINMDVNSLASKKDYVCGMTLENGSIGDTASYQGKTYGFCSKECKMEFLKDPQSQLSKN